MHFLKKYRFEICLAVLISLFVTYFSYYSILRHQTLYSNYYDLGLMDQTVYNTFKGRFLELTSKTEFFNIKRMSIHNDILLALLAPFYFIHAGPETLLVLQALIVGLGAIPLFLLSNKIIKSKSFSLLIAFCYLMYAPLERATIFDFHAVVLATSFLIWMFYFAYIKKYFWSFVFFVLSILTKENVPLTTAFFGLYVSITSFDKFNKNFKNLWNQLRTNAQKKQFYFGLLIISSSLLWFILSIWFIIPNFRDSMEGSHFALSRYSDFGDSPASIIKGVFTKPSTYIGYIFHPDTARYIFFLFSPLLFVSFFAPLVSLIALPEFAINLLSNDWNMRNIIYQYTSIITPFVFIAAIFGVSFLRKKRFKLTPLIILILLATLVSSYFKGPLPYSREKAIHPFLYPQKEEFEVAAWSKKLKNENIIVSATGQLAPHFTDRKIFYLFSNRYVASDYVILRLNEVYDYPEKDYNIKIYNQLKNDKHFQLVDKKENFEVYKKIK